VSAAGSRADTRMKNADWLDVVAAAT